jgi:hypothetical protein
MAGYEIDPCEKCEEVMQPYLDRVLSEAEVHEAEEHLAGCPYCAKRYRFEESSARTCAQVLRRADAAGAQAEAGVA